ncbi:sigma-70 family RNA polymerase sigma factor [Metabacillus indicus]|uniref:sigma-70 family RNA polymerase sigma factor n=1 Tax=Metabacillus indicus TaxID=246786 RepID=UPI002A07396B|nr:sigma-70 family RNA polymerase sigma factor [Metabacillus indicus]MDX8292223.1 sigma-70 family RNA polymerase sigma factor [Metabacillus indicus]
MDDCTFAELEKQYKPMIYHNIKKLCITRNHDEFYQAGLIAIWKASKTYDPEKGSFETYLYTSIKGSMLNEMNKMNKNRDMLEYEGIDNIPVTDDATARKDMEDLIRANCDILTKHQQIWMISHCLKEKTISEIAASEKTTPASVKSWRRGAVKKLRSLSAEEWKERFWLQPK